MASIDGYFHTEPKIRENIRYIPYVKAQSTTTKSTTKATNRLSNTLVLSSLTNLQKAATGVIKDDIIVSTGGSLPMEK